jgi:hypothetical protein
MSREFIQGSVEYLDVSVTADVNLTGTVQFSLDRGATWDAATWQGSAATTRTARLLLDTSELDQSGYPVWVKLSDTPETPIVSAGTIAVT